MGFQVPFHPRFILGSRKCSVPSMPLGTCVVHTYAPVVDVYPGSCQKHEEIVD